MIATLARCSPIEEYTTCASACPPTCTDLQYPLPKPPKPCALLCRGGCVCKQGFYRSDDGKCVASTIYTAQCVTGCFCGCSDYVRQSNKTDSPCILRDECPKECVEAD